MTFKVFVSSNQTELQEERMAVKDVILNTPIIKNYFKPVLFEDFPAGGSDPVSTYLNEVKDCDVYLGILGNEYGRKGDDGISATEREYNTFTETVTGGEAIILVKGDSEISRDHEINRFLAKTREKCVYKRFNSIDILKEEVLKSLESFLKNEGTIDSDEFDKRINREIGYEVIDEEEVKDFLEKRAVNLDVKIPEVPVREVLLNNLKVLKIFKGKIHPTNTGILFFSKEASEYLPQNEIKIARFQGVTRVHIIDSQEIKGPIYQMVDQVENFFRRNTSIANKIVDFKRIDIPEYPYEAIREGLINAIAHRDYNRTGAPIMFSIYDDRVEISSPGALMSGVTLENIDSKHEERNHSICAIFHETKDMETFGTGIHKMKESMVEHGLKEPEFRLDGGFFVVRFYGPGKNILNLVANTPEIRTTNLTDLKLNERQLKALEMMVNQKIAFTNSMYQKEFDVSRYTASRDLKDLVEKEQAYIVGKGKGTKYKATNTDAA